MTVPTTLSNTTFTGIVDGVACDCLFPVENTSHLEVTYNNDQIATLGVHYTVALFAPAYAHATVTPLPGFALLSGGVINVQRSVPIVQTMAIPTLAEIASARLEQALDYQTYVSTFLRDQYGRTVRFPRTDLPGSEGVLPVSGSRANKIAGWDAAGNWIATNTLLSTTVGDNVTTLAALKALTTRPPLVVMRGRDAVDDGGGGVFSWASGSADTADDATVVAPAGGIETGRWKRIFGGMLYFSAWFGLKGDNATDNYAGLVAAIAAIAAQGGGTLCFSKGLYRISAAVVLGTDGVCLAGSDPKTTQIVVTSATADGIVIGSTVLAPRNCTISGLGFSASVTKTAGAYVRFRRGLYCGLDNFLTQGGFRHVEFNAIYNSRVTNGRVESPAATTGCGFLFQGNRDALPNSNRGAAVYVANVECAGTAGAEPECMVKFVDFAGFDLDTVGGVQMGTAFLFQPGAADVVEAGWMYDCKGDTSVGSGISFSPAGGLIRDIVSVSGWSSACGVRGVMTSGTGTIDGIFLIGYRALLCQQSGINFAKGTLTTLSNIHISDPFVTGNSQASAGVHSGIVFTGVDHWSISGGFSRVSTINGADTHKYNIELGAGNTNYRVQGVDVAGGATGSIATPDALSPTKMIRDCIGFVTYARGVAAGGTLTTDASGNVAIPHGLSGTPVVAFVQLGGLTSPWTVNPILIGATNISVRVSNLSAAGAAVALTLVADPIMWEASL